MATNRSSVGDGVRSLGARWNSCVCEAKTPSKLSKRATLGKHPWLTRLESWYTAPPRTRLCASPSCPEEEAACGAIMPNAFLVSFASNDAFSRRSPAMIPRSSFVASVCAMVASLTAASSAGCTRSAADASRASIPSPLGPTAGHSWSVASRIPREFASPLTTCSLRSSAHALRNRSRSRSGMLMGGRCVDATRSAAQTTAPCPDPCVHASAPHSTTW